MNERNDRSRRGLYRSRRGVIFGVCRGVAERFDVSTFWVRVVTVLVFLMTGLWPTGVLYLVGALLMKPEPVLPLSSDGDHEFYDSYTSQRPLAIRRLYSTYERLSRRIARMEHTVTSRGYDWDRRFHKS